MTWSFEQEVIVTRERYARQMQRATNRGSDDTNLQALIDREMALLDQQEAETRLAAHIHDLERSAAAARTSGDDTQATAILAAKERAARLLASGSTETPEEAVERLRVVQQAVTNGYRSPEDSTAILRRLREDRYADE